MTYQLVVARYNEDISWSKKIPNTLIYNKGSALNIENEILLPNVGRESHTYLWHVVNNYDKLADVTVFFQGAPHVFSLIGEPDSEYFLTNFENSFVSFEGNMSENYTKGSLGYCLWDYRITEYEGEILNPAPWDALEWFQKFVNKTENVNRLKIYFGAHFGVKKEAILRRPKEEYETLLSQFSTKNDEVGHFFERSWRYIFSA